MQQRDWSVDEDSKNKYLIFRLGGESYGTPLLQIKEVIKMTSIKSVPHTVEHFLGVINLRGQIVSVVDLRKKLGIPAGAKGSGLILVVDAGSSNIGAVVDSIEAVKEIAPTEIDAAPAIETKIDLSHLRGVAKVAGELIILVDLNRAIPSEEMRTMKISGEAA